MLSAPFYLLGLAIALSASTGLRAESAIGPTDAFLAVAWLLASATLAGAYVTRKQDWQSIGNGPVTAIFWTFSLPLILISSMISLNNLSMQPDLFFTQFAPFVLTAAVAITCSVVIGKSITWASSPLLDGFMTGSAVLGIVLMVGLILKIPLFYYMSVRFEGLSANPNQLALQSLCIILIAVMLVSRRGVIGLYHKAIVTIAVCAALVTGLASDSDALKLSCAGLAALITLIFGFRVFQKNFWMGIATGFCSLAAMAFYWFTRSDSLGVTNALEAGNQDLDRYILWRNGIDAWLVSPLIGLGAGAWSGEVGPFGGMEAHNTVIDWLTVSGALGLGAFAWMLLQIARLNLRKEPVNYACLAALLTYSIFHFVMRTPALWLALALILTGDLRPRRARSGH